MTKKRKAPTRATTSEFDSLHSKLADTFADELDRARTRDEAPSPAMLAQIRQFLSDNNVNVPAMDKKLDRLRGALPDMDSLEQHGNVVPLVRA